MGKNRINNIFKRIYILIWIISCGWINLFAVDYPPDIANIVSTGKLRVAMVADDQIPFFFNQDGFLVGTDIDLALGIANSLGVKLVINRDAKSFNDLIPLVASGEVDVVISKLSRTLKRSQQVIFSEPYVTFHQALAFNRVMLARIADSDYKIKKYIQDFTGNIGVISGSSYVTYARLYFPKSQIVEYDSWDDVIRAVYRGEVLAAYRDEFEIKKILRTNPDLNLSLKLVILKDLQDNIAMAFKWSDVNLRDFVNIYLNGIKNTSKTTDEIFIQFNEVLQKSKLSLK